MTKKINEYFKNKITIEAYFSILRMTLAIGIAFLLAYILIVSISRTPTSDFLIMLLEPVSSKMRLIQIVNKFIPFVFTGTAVCIMMSVGQISTSAEGSFYFAGVAGTLAALIPGIPSYIHIPLCLLVGALVGGFITAFPTFINIRYDIVTIVAALLVNNVFVFFGQYLITNPFRDPNAGYEASYKFQPSAILPKLFGNRHIHLGLIIGLIIVVIAYILLYKTSFGASVRTVGHNKLFSKFSGISVMKYSVLAAFVSGCISGMGGIIECLGNYERFVYSGITNHGWNGIVIAVLCDKNPKYVPIAALFLAYLSVAGDCLNFSTIIPPEIIDIIQPIIIIFVAAPMILSKAEHKAIVKQSEKALATQKEGE